MRQYRCHHPGPLVEGASIVLSREESGHLARVRRIAAGDEVIVLDGAGNEFAARVVEPSPKGCTLSLGDALRHEPQRPASPQLALAMTRTGAFEETIERAIELGCAVFRPIESERGVVKLDERKRAARRERWERLAIERLKQCERLWMPRIVEPAPLADVLAALRGEGTVAVALRERRNTNGIAEAIARIGADASICFLVGPEGGWSPDEERQLDSADIVGVSLGRAILRAETAALAALASALAHVPPTAEESPR